MNNRPIHENLDTSFVNLSALVRYLRRRQFVGSVRLELNGYEADIRLEEDNLIRVREHDRVSGRIAEGEEAFQRLLIRAREPGGTIHVYHTVQNARHLPVAETVQKTHENQSKPVNLPAAEPVPGNSPVVVSQSSVKSEPMSNAPKFKASKPKLPDFPFELTNSVEERARQANIDASEWQLLLDLTSELLGMIDKTLADSKLDFKAAFSKSCIEISPDYPFLNPSRRVLNYSGGRITMQDQVAAKFFTAGVTEALRRILEKLGSNPKFATVYQTALNRMGVLITKRKTLYDKFFMTAKLAKIAGK